MINNNIGDVRKTFFLQLYSQVFQTRGLPEAEGSAGLQKGDQDHRAGGAQHWVLLPDAPGRGWLTEGALPLALCASPGEETESQGDPQASPHCWACHRQPLRG